VLDDDHRYIATFCDPREHTADGARAAGVEVRGGLVEEQDAWSEREDPRDGEALLLTTRKRGGRAVLAVGKADVGERAMDARPDLGGRDAVILETERHVVACPRHDQLRLGILEDEPGLTVDAKLAFLFAAARIEQPGERQEERALPGA
jgi:hypothetical protein